MRGEIILNNIYPLVLNNILFNENNILKILISNNLLNPILEFVQRLKLNYEKKTKGLLMCNPFITWTPNININMCVMDNIYILQVLGQKHINNNSDDNYKKFIKVYNIISKYIYNVKKNSAIIKLGYNGRLYDFGDLVMKQDSFGLIKVEYEPGSRIVYFPRVDKVMCNMCNPKNLATFEAMSFLQNSIITPINSYIRNITFNSVDIDLIVKSDSHKKWLDFTFRQNQLSKYISNSFGNRADTSHNGSTSNINNKPKDIGPNNNFKNLRESLIITNTSPEDDYYYTYNCNIYFDSLFIKDITTNKPNRITVYNNFKYTNENENNYELFTDIILLSNEKIDSYLQIQLELEFFMDVNYIESELTRIPKYKLYYHTSIKEGFEKILTFYPKYHFEKYIKPMTKKVLLNPFYIVEFNIKNTENIIIDRVKINSDINNYTISSNGLYSIEIKIPYIYLDTTLNLDTTLKFVNSNENKTSVVFSADEYSNNTLAIATIQNIDNIITGASSFYLILDNPSESLTSAEINFNVIDANIIVKAANNSSNIDDVFYSHTGDLVTDISNMNNDIHFRTNYSLKTDNDIIVYTDTEENIITNNKPYTQSGGYDIFYGNPMRFIAKVNNGVNLAVSQFDLFGIENTTIDTSPLLYYLDKSEINSLNIFSLLSQNKIKQLDSFTILSSINNLYINYKGPSNIYKLEASTDTHNFPYVLGLENYMENHKFIKTNVSSIYTLKITDIHTNKYIIINIKYNQQVYLYPNVYQALSIVNADDTSEEAKMTIPNGSPELPDHGQYVGKINKLNATFTGSTRPTNIKVKYYQNIPLHATINSITRTKIITGNTGLYSESFNFTQYQYTEVVFKGTYPNAKKATFPITILYDPILPISIKTVTLTYNTDPLIKGNIKNNNITFNLTTEVQDKQGIFEFTFSNMTDTFDLTLDEKTTSFKKIDKYFQLTDYDINKNNKTLTITNSHPITNIYTLHFNFKNPTPTISPIITDITTNPYIIMLNSFSKDIINYKAIINGPIDTSKFIIIIKLDQSVSNDDIFIHDKMNDLYPKMINTSPPYSKISFELDLSKGRGQYEIHMLNSLIPPPIYQITIRSDIQDISITAKTPTSEFPISSFFHLDRYYYDLYYFNGPTQFDFKVSAENIDNVTFSKTGDDIYTISKDPLNKTITFSYSNLQATDEPIITISNGYISYNYDTKSSSRKIIVNHLEYDNKMYWINPLINIFNDNWIKKSIVIYLHLLPTDINSSTYWYILKNSDENVKFLDQNLHYSGTLKCPNNYIYQDKVSGLPSTSYPIIDQDIRKQLVLSKLELPAELLQDNSNDYTFTLGFSQNEIPPDTNVEDIDKFQDGVCEYIVNILKNKDVTLRLTNHFTDEFYIDDLDKNSDNYIGWYNPDWENIDPFTIIDGSIMPFYENTMGYIFLPQNIPTYPFVFKMCEPSVILTGDINLTKSVEISSYQIFIDGIPGTSLTKHVSSVIQNYLTDPSKIDKYDHAKKYQIKINYTLTYGNHSQTIPVTLGDPTDGIKPIPIIKNIYFNMSDDIANYNWKLQPQSSKIHIASDVARISDYIYIKYETNIPLLSKGIQYDNYQLFNYDIVENNTTNNNYFSIVKLKKQDNTIKLFDPLTILSAGEEPPSVNYISFSYKIYFYYDDSPPISTDISLKYIYYQTKYIDTDKIFTKDTLIKLSNKSIINNSHNHNYEIIVNFDKSSKGKLLTIKNLTSSIIDINNILLYNSHLNNINITSIDIHNISSKLQLQNITPYFHPISIKMNNNELLTTSNRYLSNISNTSLIFNIQSSKKYTSTTGNVNLTLPNITSHYSISILKYNNVQITDNKFSLKSGPHNLTLTLTPNETYDYTINITIIIDYETGSTVVPIFSSFGTLTWLDYKNTVTFSHKNTLTQYNNLDHPLNAPIFVADTPLSYVNPNTRLVNNSSNQLYDTGISTENYLTVTNLSNDTPKSIEITEYLDNYSSAFFKIACNNNPNLTADHVKVCMGDPNEYKMQFYPQLNYVNEVLGHSLILFMIDPFNADAINYFDSYNFSALTSDHVKNVWEGASNNLFSGSASNESWNNTLYAPELGPNFCSTDPNVPPKPITSLSMVGINITPLTSEKKEMLIQNWLGDNLPNNMEKCRRCLLLTTQDAWPNTAAPIFEPIPVGTNPDHSANLTNAITWSNVLTMLDKHNPDDITRRYQIYAYKETMDEEINIQATLVTLGTLSSMETLYLTQVSTYNKVSYITNINKNITNNNSNIPKSQNLLFNTSQPQYQIANTTEIKNSIYTINDPNSNFNNITSNKIDDIINNDIFLSSSSVTHDNVLTHDESIFNEHIGDVLKHGSYVTSSSIRISSKDPMGGGRIYISQYPISFEYVTDNDNVIQPLRVLNKRNRIDFIEFTITGTSIFCNTSNVDSINNVYQFQGVGWDNKIFSGDDKYKNKWNVMGFEPTLFSNTLTMVDRMIKPIIEINVTGGIMKNLKFYNESSNNINNHSLFSLHTDIFKFTLLKDILAGSGEADLRDMGGYNITFPSPNTILSSWVANPTINVLKDPKDPKQGSSFVLKTPENITKMQKMAKLYISFFDVYTEICEEVQYKTIEKSQGGVGTLDIYDIAKLDTIGNSVNINNWFITTVETSPGLKQQILPPIKYWENIGFNQINSTYDPSNRQFLFYSNDIIYDGNISYIINKTKINIKYISVILPSKLNTKLIRINESGWSEYRINLLSGHSLFESKWVEYIAAGTTPITYTDTNMVQVKENMTRFFSRQYCAEKNSKKDNTIYPDYKTYKIKSFIIIALGSSQSKDPNAPDFNLLTFVFDYVSKNGNTFADNTTINNMNLQAGLYGTHPSKLIDKGPPPQPYFTSTGYIDLTCTLGLSAYTGMGLYQADSPGKLDGSTGIPIITIDGALRTAVIASYCRGTIHQHLAEVGDEYFFNPSNFYCVNQKLNGKTLTSSSQHLYPSEVKNAYDGSGILMDLGFYTDTNTNVEQWNYTLLYAGFVHLISTQPYQKAYAMAYDDFGAAFAPTIDYNPKYLNFLDMSNYNGLKTGFPSQ